MNKLEKLEDGKAAGPDGIASIVLKRCRVEIAKALEIIFNKSLEKSVVPEVWREGLVVLIFKKGSKTGPNYRPVSLTCIPCKVMEGILKDRMMHETVWVWSVTEQHGFRSGRSTVSNRIEFYDQVTESLDKGAPLDKLFFDLPKAFDKVPHGKLIAKMRKLDINSKIIDWTEDYLNGRVQRVIVRGQKSDKLEVYSGVPQGSVLGPVLFTLYIHDLPAQIKSKLSIFADDTKMMSEVGSHSGVEMIKKDLKQLEAWANTNGMKFNPDKCSVMHCGNNNSKVEYRIYGNKIRETSCEKDLGILIDKDLNFKEQTSASVNKANQKLGIIRRTFAKLSPKMFIILYQMIVRPHLEYAVQLWAPHHQGLMNKIEAVQRRATKMVKGFNRLSYSERLKELDLMSTEARRTRGDMILTYRVISKKLDLGRNVFNP